MKECKHVWVGGECPVEIEAKDKKKIDKKALKIMNDWINKNNVRHTYKFCVLCNDKLIGIELDEVEK